MSDETKRPIVTLGEAGAEMRAIQILAFALNNAATWVGENVPELSNKPIPPLLLGAARAVSFASVAGLDTPVEILALAARNTFELYVRFKHILMSDDNSLAWREEAVTDQLQVYEGILSQNPPEQLKEVFRSEMERVKAHAANRGLQARKLLTMWDVARETHLDGEYKAFYKLYSKFVHPSSFLTNWPVAASTPMYRDAFIFNLQIYGHLILKELHDAHGLLSSDMIDDGERQLNAMLNSN
jgi:hypothetical protein